MTMGYNKNNKPEASAQSVMSEKSRITTIFDTCPNEPIAIHTSSDLYEMTTYGGYDFTFLYGLIEDKQATKLVRLVAMGDLFLNSCPHFSMEQYLLDNDRCYYVSQDTYVYRDCVFEVCSTDCVVYVGINAIYQLISTDPTLCCSEPTYDMSWNPAMRSCVNFEESDHYYHIKHVHSELLEKFSLKNDIDLCVGYFAQSGEVPDDYFPSKWKKKQSAREKLQCKIRKKLRKIEDLNLGSKKKHVKKQLEKKLKNLKIERHSGDQDEEQREPADTPLSDFAKAFIGDDYNNVEIVVSIIEKVLLQLYVIYGNDNVAKVVGELLALMPGSRITELSRVLIDMLRHFKLGELTLNGIKEMVAEMLQNWDSFRSNQYARSFLTSLTACFSYFLAPSLVGENNDMLWSHITRFFENAIAGDFITTAIQSFHYVVGGISHYVKEGDLGGFITSGTYTEGLSEKFSEVRRLQHAFTTKDLVQVKGMMVQAYYPLIRACEDYLAYVKLIINCVPKQMRSSIQRGRDNVEDIMRSAMMEKHNTKTRIAPLAIMVHGPTSIGKSTIMKLIAKIICGANNIPYGEEFYQYHNADDKHPGETWKNSATVYFEDDVHNARPKDSDVDNFVQIVNSMPSMLPAASLEKKSRMWVNILLHISSTNSKSCYFFEATDFSSTRTRRYAYRITAKVKPQYRKENTSSGTEWGYEESCCLDQSKIPKEMMGKALLDVWHFTVWKSEIANDKEYELKSTYAEGAKMSETDNSWRCVQVQDEEGWMADIDIYRLARFLTRESKKYYKMQQHVVDFCNTANEEMMCYNCFEHDQDCNCSLPSLHGPTSSGPVSNFEPSDEADDPDMPDLVEDESEDEEVPPERTMVFTRDVGDEESDEESSDSGLVTLNPDAEEFVPRKPDPTNSFVFVEKQSFMGNTIRKVNKQVEVQSKLLEYLNGGHSENADSLVRSVFLNAKDTVTGVSRFLDTVCDAFTAQVVSRLLTNFLQSFVHDPHLATASMLPQVFDDVGIGEVLRSNSKTYHVLRFFDNLLGSFMTPSLCCSNDKPTPVTDFVLRKKCHDTIRAGCTHSMVNSCTKHLMSEGPSIFDRLLTWGKTHKKVCNDGSVFNYFPVKDEPNQCKTMAKLVEFDNRVRSDCPSHIRDVGIPLVTVAAICLKLYRLLSKCTTAIVGGQAGIDLDGDNLTSFDKERSDADRAKRMYAMAFEVPGKPGMRNHEVLNRCENNVIVIKNPYDKTYTNSFVVCDGLLLAPHHYFSDIFSKVGKQVLEFHLIRFPINGPVVPGNARMVVRLDKSSIYQFTGSNGKPMDLVAVSIPGTSMFTNMYERFVDEYAPLLSMSTTVHKDSYGSIIRIDTPFRITSSTECYNDTNYHNDGVYDTFNGYHGEYECRKGVCGSPLVDNTKADARIIGIHLGGNEQLKIGVCACVTKSMIDEATQHFDIMPPVDAHSGIHKTGLIVGNHDKNVLFSMDVDSPKILPVGQFSKRCKHKSRVIDTSISAKVKKSFPKVKLDYAPPPLRGPEHNDKRYPYKALYNNLSGRHAYFPPQLVKDAIADYKSRIYSRAEEIKEQNACLKPLTEYEIVNGIDGLAFINGINMSAGGGNKYRGKKSNYAFRVGDKWDFNEDVWHDIRDADSLARDGKRFWGTFNAFPKDEPTTKANREKGKVRTVFGSDLVLQCLTRKYFAGTIRWFNTNSTTTECSVGINPSSPMWHHMLNSLVNRKTNKNLKNMFATDYSKYDLNMPPNIIDAAFDLLIDFNMSFGSFSHEDFMAMVTLKDEILKALVDCNGDAVMLLSILCSGVPLTSLLGSVCNSLMVRACYASVVDDVPFLEGVSMMTFSDDIFGTISSSVVSRFNMQSMCQIMGNWGTVVTSAQKDGKLIPKTISLKDVDFLKRSFRFDYEFGGVYVAPLKEQSILKPLVSMIKPTCVTEQAQLAQNLDAAMDEYLLHGRSKYNKAQKKLTSIAVDTGLIKVADRLTLTFDEALTKWKCKYAEIDNTQVTNPLVAGAMRARQALSTIFPVI